MKFASALAVGLAMGPCASAKTIEVFSDQSDSEPSPLQAAIDLAKPGDTVMMNAGMYDEDLKTKRDGELDAPITIMGPKSAVIRGKSGDSIMEINHDFIHLVGFSIDGSGEQEEADNLDPEFFHGHLIDVHGNRVRMVLHDEHEHRSGVMGFKADRLTLSHAGGTCIKMSYFVTHSEIINSDILECGMSQTVCEDDSVDGCGRGLDLGTPPAKRTENIGEETDVSAWNTIKGNTFSGVGGACIIIHEGARSNLIDSSTCIDSNDASSAGMVVRGIANILRSNSITGAAGAGLALGGTEAGDECELSGVFNQVYHNQLASNGGGALLDGALPQPSGKVCRNSVDEDTFPELAQDCPDEEEEEEEEEQQQEITGSDRDGGGVDVGLPDTKATPAAKQGSESPYRCHPVLLSSADVTASNAEGADEKFDGEVVLDRDAKTFWSLEGLGEWLEFDLNRDSVVEPPTVEAVEVHFLEGKKHKAFFEVRADGEGVLNESASSGTTDEPELFKFPGGGVKAKTIRFVGLGSMNADAEFSKWNSVSSITLCEGAPTMDGRKAEEGPEP